MTAEQFSRLYALLGDRTSNPGGDEWEHGPLNRLVRDIEALMTTHPAADVHPERHADNRQVTTANPDGATTNEETSTDAR